MSSHNFTRRFNLVRTVDRTGMSGTGIIAEGIVWTDGTASVRWLGERPSTVFWDRGWEDAEYIHTHGGDGDTKLVFVDKDVEDHNLGRVMTGLIKP